MPTMPKYRHGYSVVTIPPTSKVAAERGRKSKIVFQRPAPDFREVGGKAVPLTLRAVRAEGRTLARAEVSPEDQIAILDARLGAGVGAVRERARLAAMIAPARRRRNH